MFFEQLARSAVQNLLTEGEISSACHPTELNWCKCRQKERLSSLCPYCPLSVFLCPPPSCLLHPFSFHPFIFLSSPPCTFSLFFILCSSFALSPLCPPAAVFFSSLCPPCTLLSRLTSPPSRARGEL